jgi:hypothetical protein
MTQKVMEVRGRTFAHPPTKEYVRSQLCSLQVGCWRDTGGALQDFAGGACIARRVRFLLTNRTSRLIVGFSRNDSPRKDRC